MFTKKLNTFILVASQVLNFAIIMFFAMLLAKLVWWIINPTIGDVYVEKMSATQFDSSAKYIVNRYPFGVIVKAKATEEAPPQIVDQIKVTGIYRGGASDSMVLIEASGKTLVYKLGAMIMGSATLKAINSDGIVVTEDGRDAIIKISNGSGVAGTVPPPSGHSGSAPHFGGQQQDQQTAPPPTSNADSTVSDFKERRRKMIEEFAQQRGGAPSANADGTDGSSSNQATTSSVTPTPGSGNPDNTVGNTNNAAPNGSNGNPDINKH